MPNSEEIEWFGSELAPDHFNQAHNGLTVDVLVETSSREHTIGWFDFNKHEWQFLCREVIGKFKWRYLSKKYDRWTPPERIKYLVEK